MGVPAALLGLTSVSSSGPETRQPRESREEGSSSDATEPDRNLIQMIHVSVSTEVRLAWDAELRPTAVILQQPQLGFFDAELELVAWRPASERGRGPTDVVQLARDLVHAAWPAADAAMNRDEQREPNASGRYVDASNTEVRFSGWTL